MASKLFLLIDEFQTLDCNRRSIIGLCLTEGQKYGANLILATQFLDGNFSDAVISQFKQGGFRFYFRLTEEEAAIVSRQLVYNLNSGAQLRKKLAELPKGNCLMVGPHTVGEKEEISENIRFLEIVCVEESTGKIVVVVPERGKDRIEKPNRATLQHIIDQGSQYRGKLHAKTRYPRPN